MTLAHIYLPGEGREGGREQRVMERADDGRKKKKKETKSESRERERERGTSRGRDRCQEAEVREGE